MPRADVRARPYAGLVLILTMGTMGTAVVTSSYLSFARLDDIRAMKPFERT